MEVGKQLSMNMAIIHQTPCIHVVHFIMPRHTTYYLAYECISIYISSVSLPSTLGIPNTLWFMPYGLWDDMWTEVMILFTVQ